MNDCYIFLKENQPPFIHLLSAFFASAKFPATGARYAAMPGGALPKENRIQKRGAASELAAKDCYSLTAPAGRASGCRSCCGFVPLLLWLLAGNSLWRFAGCWYVGKTFDCMQLPAIWSAALLVVLRWYVDQ